MTVAIKSRGMTSESREEKQESNHEFNFFIDRQLQNKLLQADDDLLAEEGTVDKAVIRNNMKSGKVVKNDAKIDKFGDFTGWFPDQKLVCRKLDGAKTDQKPRENTFIHPWRDYKRNKEETYEFKHYTDIRKYIEQYRREHCRQSQSNRFSSGGTDRERRYAYPSPATQQPPVQVQVQALWKGPPGPTPENPALHYTNRKESLGTLVTPISTQNANCSCSRPNHIHTDLTSQAHRYKLVPSPFSRTNAVDLRSQHGDSDNSSESGDSRTKTPRPRINSAASVTGRAIIKSPTKISVPAQGVHNGVRPYPIQALTIQQTSLKSSDPSPAANSSKPLDNLNVVAPEKQPLIVERKEVEPITPSLQVYNSNNLLSSNEAPLRGYAVKKTPSPRTGQKDVITVENAEAQTLSADSDTESNTAHSSDAISIERLSTCPLSADVKVKHKMSDQTSQMLEMFLSDPVLSKLNQRPNIYDSMSAAENSNTKNQIFLPQNDPNLTYRVNMWNPILSAPKAMRSSGNCHPESRDLVLQKPFHKPSGDLFAGAKSSLAKNVKIINDLPEKGKYSGRVLEKNDYFHPVKKIKISITKLDNAVSFCRTQVETNDKALSRKIKSVKTSECNSHKFGKNILKTEHTDNNKVDSNLVKSKMFENLPKRQPDIGAENMGTEKHVSGKLFTDSISHMEIPTNRNFEANRNLNDIIKQVIVQDEKNGMINPGISNTVKHISFNDKRDERVDTCIRNSLSKKHDGENDEQNNDIFEIRIKESSFIGKESEQMANELIECPLIVEPLQKHAELKIDKNEIYEHPLVQEKHDNKEATVKRSLSFNVVDQNEHAFYIDNGNSNSNLSSRYSLSRTDLSTRESKSKSDQSPRGLNTRSDLDTRESRSKTVVGIIDTGLTENKQNLSLPKRVKFPLAFGISSPLKKNQNHITKEKSPGPEPVCSTISLQNKQCKLHDWRLNRINNKNGEQVTGCMKENLGGNDINRSILKGTNITVGRVNEFENSKNQTVFDLDAQSPRNSQQSQSGKAIKRKVKKTALASGKRMHEHPDLEGLTWAEKLEFLRSVNKRPAKPKAKPQKLRYVKDEPDALPTSEHEQLYEQRRIKHLVEQARIKGGKQFNWVNEIRVKVRNAKKTSRKFTAEEAVMQQCNDSECSSAGSIDGEDSGEERNFGKYGIYVPQRGAPQKLFDCHNITRSNTCMFSS